MYLIDKTELMLNQPCFFGKVLYQPTLNGREPILIGSSPNSGKSYVPFLFVPEGIPGRGARPGVRRPPLDPRPGNLQAGSPIARATGPLPDWGLRGGPPRPGYAFSPAPCLEGEPAPPSDNLLQASPCAIDKKALKETRLFGYPKGSVPGDGRRSF